jgi:NADPH-dependent glutamate synthase beta subunit-like oxidoreductase/NAD(P)H-flavin reductase
VPQGFPPAKENGIAMHGLSLKFGFEFADLYRRQGLVRLDGVFIDWLSQIGPEAASLTQDLLSARATPLPEAEEASLIIALAPYLEQFIAIFFGIEKELATLAMDHKNLSPLYNVKRAFVQRQVAKAIKAEQAQHLDGRALRTALTPFIVRAQDAQTNTKTPHSSAWQELDFASAVTAWQEDAAAFELPLKLASDYTAWALYHPEGQREHQQGVLFKLPHKIDPAHLVPYETISVDGVRMHRLPEAQQRQRHGFNLTDVGTDLCGALDEAHYCIWCHHQGKDSCSKGLKDKKSGAFQKTASGVNLAGCPLEEKISQMHEVRAAGYAVGALGVIIIDNPMCPATGHRICNDCMKSCIYQKQQPVDIPQSETRILKDVLALPWGFEIYSLLTRWNPLNFARPLPKPTSGYKVLVVGMGPAGYTLAHHLLNDGHHVVGIDGLKIEPLDPLLSGKTWADGRVGAVDFLPIQDVHSLYEPLGTRIVGGFGGVAEYGITVRWDKNFLKLVRLVLERRQEMALIGGVRFGGSLTIEEAFAAGFDHIALATGAGRPTVVSMKNALARGVRQASDFLMALQLTGAAKENSLANLQVRLPALVIGGGLTGIDTTTELLAYYPLQVEKFLQRYESLVTKRGEPAVRAGWSEEEQIIADEFIAHAKALRQERAQAAKEGRPARVRELLQSWGGATLVYRRALTEAPSYTLNHEEVALALREGIGIADNLTPVEVTLDRYGHAEGLVVERRAEGEEAITQHLKARTILVAAGTQPNTVLAREAPSWVSLDGKYFRALDEEGKPASPQRLAKPGAVHVLMARHQDGRGISFFGDLHPSFAGNVVKAMGGAKQGYPVVSRIMAQRPPTPIAGDKLLAQMQQELRAEVAAVHRLTPNIVEVVVKAPRAARAFEPGQFYRLQNFESLSPVVGGTSLAMEGLALTGASVDKAAGLLSTIVLEMGGSSDLCALLKPGEPIVLMGPTGTPTHITPGETVALVGGGLGNAVLFSIGQAARAKGALVLYFAGYKKRLDRYKVEEIERAADVIIWCCDEAPGFIVDKPGQASFTGNIVAAMAAYGAGELMPIAKGFELSAIDRMIVIGSDRMMAAVAAARHGVLARFLKPHHLAIGSINSPMQCMMKEICAQCLQTHIDPVTGQETVVFSCFNQDQELDHVDFHCLNQRLQQNGLQEKLTRLWLDETLKAAKLRPAAE